MSLLISLFIATLLCGMGTGALIGVLASNMFDAARSCTDEFEEGESLRRRFERPLLTHPEIDQANDIRGCRL